MKVKEKPDLRVNGNGRVISHPLAAPEETQSHLYDDERGLERIIFFSDAVFAIAITLLALEIRLPPLAEAVSNADLLAAIGSLGGRYLSYVISFLTIGLMWMAHHRTFRSIRRYNERLMLVNILSLLLIAFVPIPTAVIGEHGNAVGTIFYAAVMGAAGLLLALLWWYANAQGRLVARPLPSRVFRRLWLRNLWTPAIFFLSMPVALVSPDAAKYCWLLILATVFWHE